MKLELFLKFNLAATHSLDERETPHEHTWIIDAGFSGPLEKGRIVSLPALRAGLDPIVAKLRGTFLNTNPELNLDSREYPTCEYLAFYFAEKFQTVAGQWPGVHVTSVEVAVVEPDGEVGGQAKLTL